MANTTNAKYCTNCALSLLQPTDAPKRTDRVEELLRQNHPPLDVELPAFREIVETTPATLAALDLKISQAEELLNALLSARHQTQSQFEDAKALLHPMCSIPNELLAKIFDHCIVKPYSDEDQVEALDALDPRAAPWLLSGVCRRWRNLAINLPQLWTHLSLDFDKQRGHITGRQCAYKVGLFNERSRGLPMTVYLGSAEDDFTDHPVLASLEVSIPRWEALRVDLPRISLQCLSGNNFLNLQRLLFHPRTKSQWHLNLDVFRPTKAPALRQLGLDSQCSLAALKFVSLPWAQLTHIFNILVDTHALDYFAKMTNVQELTVNLSDIYTPSECAISLPKLRCLSLFEDETAAPGHIKRFFSTLTIPCLSELGLNFPDQEHLCLFPTSSTGSLEKVVRLDITCTTSLHIDNTRNLLDFLTLTRRVEELRIYDVCIPADLCIGLTSSKSTSSRLPSLRILDIADCDDILADDMPLLFDMLESRTTAAPQPGTDSDVPGNMLNNVGDPSARQHRSCLRTVRVPRWLYTQDCQRWRSLCTVLEVECSVFMDDRPGDTKDDE